MKNRIFESISIESPFTVEDLALAYDRLQSFDSLIRAVENATAHGTALSTMVDIELVNFALDNYDSVAEDRKNVLLVGGVEQARCVAHHLQGETTVVVLEAPVKPFTLAAESMDTLSDTLVKLTKSLPFVDKPVKSKRRRWKKPK